LKNFLKKGGGGLTPKPPSSPENAPGSLGIQGRNKGKVEHSPGAPRFRGRKIQ